MVIFLKKFFCNLFNERGETLNAEENQTTGKETADDQQGKKQDDNTPAAGTQVNWDDDSNPYKKRYGDSQSQIQPLVRTLAEFAEYDHTTKSWKPKSKDVPEKEEDVEKILEGYDPEFRKSLGGYVSKQIKSALTEFQKNQSSLTEYNSSMLSARSKAVEEFGEEFDFAKNGKMNPDSPLYKLSNEILTNKYAQFNPDGTFFRYRDPEAEYLSTVEAYAILARRSKQTNQQGKEKFSAIQGKGTKSNAAKKSLTYEEYNKLTNEQKDAYDLQQAG